MDVTMDIKNLNKFIEIAEKYPALAEKHFRSATEQSFKLMMGTLMTKAPKGVTGDLRRAWVAEYGRFFSTLTSAMKYATDVEYGTSPHYVSPKELEKWADKKGVNAVAVSRSIAKKGTKANPYFKSTIEYTRDVINKTFDKEIVKMLQEML